MAKKVIVIEVQKQSVSAVELTSQTSGIEIVHYLWWKIPTTGFDYDEFRKVWLEAGFTAKKVISVLPNSLVKYRTITIPSLIPIKQLDAAIRLELETEYGEGIIYKIRKIQEQDVNTVIKVAIVRNDDLAQHNQLIRAAGLEVAWAGLRTRGLHNFLNMNQDVFSNQPLYSAYLDLGSEKAELGIVQGEDIIYCREFSPGADILSNGDPIAEADFWEEVRISFTAFSMNTGLQPPDMIRIFGQIPVKLVTAGKWSDLGCKPVKSDLSQFNGVRIPDHQLAMIAPLLGLGLDNLGSFAQEGQWFYSREQQLSQVKRGQYLAFGKALIIGALLGGGLLLAVQAGVVKDRKNQSWLSLYAEKFQQLQQIEVTTNRDLAAIRTMESWIDNTSSEIEFLRLFQKHLPEGTVISDITIEDGTVKDISGVTPTVSVMLGQFRKISGLAKLKMKGMITVTDQGEIFHLEGPILIKEQGQ